MEPILIFILFFAFTMLFFTMTCAIIFIDNYEILWLDPKPKKKYSISAIIPAYNEEDSIEQTIMSIHNQNYPKELLEIIVANDGSTDNTKKICERLKKKGIIRLINKENTGKANSVNMAIKLAKNELIYLLDADSFADKDSFNHLIGYFNDKKVSAVSSSMKAKGKSTFFEKMQWIEYLLSILYRKVQSLFNSMYVTPGPGSIYRKQALEELGGFNEETLTEDMEMAFKMQNNGFIIENSLNSIVYTKTPSKLNDLLKQRKRWYAGYFEDSISYKHLLLNPKRGPLSALLTFNIFSISCVLGLFVYSILKSIFISIEQFTYFKATDYLIRLPEIRAFQLFYGINIDLIVFMIISFFSAIMIYMSVKSSGEKMDIKKNLPMYLGYAFIYSIFLSLFWISGFIHKFFIRRKGEKWHG